MIFPLRYSPPLLILEWVHEASTGRWMAEPATQPDERQFGRQLAALHQADFPCFGRPDGATTGSLALPNDPCPSWARFLAERRLRPLAQIAKERASLPDATIERLEALADRADEADGPLGPWDSEVPSLLHGDLWAGNRIVDTEGESWVIDPACFGGHREFDLAMMRLFGGFGDAVFAAYDEAFPLTDGWEHRIALHQLPPLIVHAIKFGGGYVAAVADALNRLAH